MEIIEGTATISLETLDKLRNEAAQSEKLFEGCAKITEEVMEIYSFEVEEYHRELDKIDNNKKLSDE